MMKITTTDAHLRPGVSHTVNGILFWSSVLICFEDFGKSNGFG